MESHVIILNGPAGVGKTTVGRLLADLAPDSVCIHGDVLRDFVVRRTSPHVQTGMAYVNGATMAANYLRAGYERVVFEFVFENRAHVERFRAAFGAPYPVYMFTLWASLSTVMEREHARPGRERLGERVEAYYRSIESALDHLGVVISTEGRIPDAIAHEIAALVASGTGVIQD